MAAVNITAMAAGTSSAGFYNSDKLSSAGNSAYESKYTEVKWSLAEKNGRGVPVPYENTLLVPSGSSILRISEADGSNLGEIPLGREICTEYSGAVLGDVLIQPTKNSIAKVNLESGEVTLHELSGEIGSDLALIDSFAYFSVEAGEGETMYCIDMADGFKTVWEYKSDSGITSPTLYGSYVVFGAGEKLVTHHRSESSVCEIPVSGEITETPFASQYAVFFSENSGNVCKLRLNSDGTMEEDSLVKCDVGASPSAPLYWNNRLYVASDSGFHVMDSINMETETTFDSIKGGTAPFVCYGSGARIYTIAPYNDNGTEKMALHCITDFGEDAEPTDAILALMDKFGDGRYTVSENGTIYVRDSIGRVFTLTRVPYDIFTMVVKLVILLALVVGVFIWLRYIKKRKEKLKPRY